MTHRYDEPDFHESQTIALRCLRLLNRLNRKINREEQRRCLLELHRLKSTAKHHMTIDILINQRFRIREATGR